jgi:hypothetical protein
MGPRQYLLTAWSGISRNRVITETAMKTTACHRKAIGRAMVASIALSAGVAFAAGTTVDATASNADAVVVAQAAMPAPPTRVIVDVYPSYQAGVRAAAAQGPEALRRYLWRTRMIYNFYYDDFAPRA